MKAILDELDPLLRGQTLQDLVQLESHRFLLRFEEPPFPRLHIAIHPRLSTLHLARGIKAPTSVTELAMALGRELSGRRVAGLSKPRAERLVRIQFEGGRTLVAELMGKASNLLLLDEEDRILRYARSHQGGFRHPAEGAIYHPPPASSRWIAADLEEITEEQFREIAAGAAREDASAGGSSLQDLLLESLPGFSMHLAREIHERARVGEEPWRVFTELVSRLARAEYDPALYSPVAPRKMSESIPLTSRVLFAFPFPLRHASSLARTPARSVNEAEEAATACLLRHMAYVSVQQSLRGLLRQERRRIADLIGVLESELSEAEEAGDEERRWAELILAGMHAARKRGSVVSVVDHYDVRQRAVEIPIDPRLSLQDNAQRYFKSARRRSRTREMLPGRLESLRIRLARVEEAAGQVQAADSRETLDSLEHELQEGGIVRAFRKRERSEVGRKAAYVRTREFRTRDGFTVLVGKTEAENDHLTFKVAAPHDLWLHAAGCPGAHVIVRNPRRLASLPSSTVLEAAGIAAYFSKGKGEKDLDVHVAWRRHVRKGKGMPPGMVMLKKHETVRAAPALPEARALFD